MGVETYLPLVLLFLTSGVPSNAQKAAAAQAEAEAPPAETTLAVAAGAPLTVECWLRVEQRADWRLDEGAPPADMRADVEGAPRGGWLPARLRAAAARRGHAGLYTCARGPDARRVRVRVTASALAEAEPATAAAAASGGDVLVAAAEHYYEINRALTLNCTNSDDDKDTYSWSKNGTDVTKLGDLTGRYELAEGGAVFKVKQGLEDDFGNYTCQTAAGVTAAWQVRGKPHARLAPNSNVVEGQKLKLQCKVVGKPHPVVTWTYRNASGPEGGALLVENERVRFEAGEGGVERATLVLETAQRDDAGEYSCVPGERGVRATTTLRVKDMYAALWPFLGICAEVFVLCAIILVYEKRRTKPELDDSDTDNHDQKKS